MPRFNALPPADRLGREWAYVHAGGHGPAEPGDVGGGAGQVVVNGNGSCRGQIGSEFVQSPALAAFRVLICFGVSFVLHKMIPRKV